MLPECLWPHRAGFVHFVLRLKKGQYLEQFGQYAWTHMILLVGLAFTAHKTSVMLSSSNLWSRVVDCPARESVGVVAKGTPAGQCSSSNHCRQGAIVETKALPQVVFIPTSFFVSNIFDGLIWFLLPCALVIINDIGAYLVGAHARIKPSSSCYGLPSALCRSLLRESSNAVHASSP